jgi:hypothetical protein
MIENDVQALYVGHDHANDYGGFFDIKGRQIEMAYGKKTGYAGQSIPRDMKRGGKVIEIKSFRGVVNAFEFRVG